VRAYVCVCGVDEILSLMFKHFSSTSSNVSCVRQTFQLDAKHFSSALDETLGTFHSINLLMTSTSLPNERTNERTNAHFSKQFFQMILCSTSIQIACHFNFASRDRDSILGEPCCSW
jgi:hypothetical protein